MTWAEEIGLGEMGLMPWQFWRLTFREFQLKHEAFMRSENRWRSLIFEHAEMIGQFKDKDRKALRKSVNALRRYPVKRWLA